MLKNLNFLSVICKLEALWQSRVCYIMGPDIMGHMYKICLFSPYFSCKLYGIIHQLMTLPAPGIDDRPDPAVIMFKAVVVQSFLLNFTKRFQTGSSSINRKQQLSITRERPACFTCKHLRLIHMLSQMFHLGNDIIPDCL